AALPASTPAASAAAAAPATDTAGTAFGVIAAISFSHLLNDLMQALLPAMYPMLKDSYALSFGQIGLLTFTYQCTASLLQPLVGAYTDRQPRPYSLVARMASGGRHGLAQSLFQVGGNAGSAIGPLLAALIILPRGQGSAAWFCLAALLGMVLTGLVGRWYRAHGLLRLKPRPGAAAAAALPPTQVRKAIYVLLALIFSKFFYLASL